jgi:hypothetical protein
MKNYKQFIGESKKDTLKEQWWKAVYFGDSIKVKTLIKKGVDVNMKDDDNNLTALLFVSSYYKNNSLTFDTLLQHPNIDVTVKDKKGFNFIDNLKHSYYFENKTDLKYALMIYHIQKKIIENGREDIILFLNKYKMVHPKIKEEYPHIFTGAELNLL